MAVTIRARVEDGLLKSLEKVDLPEGEEVLVAVIGVVGHRRGEGLRRSFGRWKGTLDADALIRNIYADRLISTRPEPKL